MVRGRVGLGRGASTHVPGLMLSCVTDRGGQLINRPIEPWWVRMSYLTAAALAAAGDALLLRAGSSSNRAWTAYLGIYLLLAVGSAVAGGVMRPGAIRAACRGAATGAAVSFIILGALTFGVLFAPLAAWLAIATYGGGRLEPKQDAAAALGSALAIVIPLAGVMTVFHW